MAQPNNPLKPVADIATKLHKALSRMLTAWQKIFRNLTGFLRNLISAIKKGLTQFIAAVGKATVQGFLKAGERLLDKAEPLLADIGEIVDTLAKVIAIVAKAADPRAAVARLKSLVKKIAQLLARLLAQVLAFIAELNLLAPLLKVIDTFRAVLQLMFKWISQVSGALTAVKTARALLKKALAELKSHIKDAAQLIRELAAIPA